MMVKRHNDIGKKKRKADLKAAAAAHQQALYKELNSSADRLVEFGKAMAVAGGILYVGYTILDRYLDSKLKTEEKPDDSGKYATLHKIILPFVALALQQGSTVLLKKAQQMLIDYLEEKNKADVPQE